MGEENNDIDVKKETKNTMNDNKNISSKQEIKEKRDLSMENKKTAVVSKGNEETVSEVLSQKKSFGFLETQSFVALVQATDAILKAADISIIRYEKLGKALVAICIQGDIGSVRVALDAGVAVLKQLRQPVGAAILSNPHSDLIAAINN